MEGNPTPTPEAAAQVAAPAPSAPASPTPQAAPVHEPAPEVDLSELLAEFDAATKPQPTAQQPTATSKQPVDDLADLLSEAQQSGDLVAISEAITKANQAYQQALQSGASADSLRQQFGILQNSVNLMYQHQAAMRDHAEFSGFVAEADGMLKEAGISVGKEFTKRFLMSEALTDPVLRHAFDHRYDSKESLRNFERVKDRMTQKLLKAAKAEPDQQATADRAAVALAVRSSTNKMPERPPVKYGELNDAEFKKELSKYGL
jgi:hypothetical protein